MLSELIVAIVGILFGYVVARVQDLTKEQNQRKSVATGLLAELGRISRMLDLLRKSEPKSIVAAQTLATPIKDIFRENIALFKPRTIEVVTNFFALLEELRHKITDYREHRDEPGTTTSDQINSIAFHVFILCAGVMVYLKKEGGTLPQFMAFSSEVELYRIAETELKE